MRIKFLFAWLVILGLVAAGILGVANIGDAVAVGNASSRVNEGPKKQIELPVAGERTARFKITAGELVGVRLRNPLGELVGSVKAIATDTFTNKTYAVLHYDAPPIRRERDLIVPLELIKAQPGKEEYLLNIDRYQLENAREFEQGDFTNTVSAYWSKGNQAKLEFNAPQLGSAGGGGGDLGFVDRFSRGLRVIWSKITGA